MAGNDYAASTLEDPATICDYVHPNSINVDAKDNNIIASMRNMSSVIKFDRNATRTLMLELDEAAKTASVVNVINGVDYEEQTGAKHWGTHCGNVTYQTAASAVIGWGLHVKLDTSAESLGQKPMVTEINPETGELLFEVVPNRNPNNAAERTSFMSYRTYKTAD